QDHDDTAIKDSSERAKFKDGTPEYIEENSKVHANSSRILHTDYDVQWHLARISHRQRGHSDYTYDASAGNGTCAYVLGTGIDSGHPEFEGRAKQLISFDSSSGKDEADHGTGVASIIAGKTLGVAKKTKIFGVRFFSQKDEMVGTSTLVKAIDYIIEHQAQMKSEGECVNGVFVNYSVTGGDSDKQDEAFEKLAKQVSFVAAAAGNDGGSATKETLVNAPSVCIIGAINRKDALIFNYGRLVDILAPGDEMLTANAYQRGGYATRRGGTSYSTAVVVGMAANLAAAEGLGGIGSRALCDRIKEMATKDAVINPRLDTVNLIAYNGVKDVDDDNSERLTKKS
ncbi:hypothetical protein CP533_5425, partial [Ophiocordyceps camponoti-saundersi (nom. inval.)]